MKNMRIFWGIIISSAISQACVDRDMPEVHYTPKFVVEGIIPAGGHPRVSLTHNLPISSIIDSAQLEKIIIRWAKVEVFNDNEHEVLTLVKKDNGFPFYHYVGRTLRGREGSAYQLRITYAGQVIEARTAIPRKPMIDKIAFSPTGDSLRVLQVSFTDEPTSKDFYRFYGKYRRDANYSSFTPGGLSDEQASGQSVTLNLFRNKSSNIGPEVDMYYKVGDTIQFKLANMTEDAFTFWKQAAAIAGQLPSLGSPVRIEGNVSGPALGIWYGEAYDERHVIVN